MHGTNNIKIMQSSFLSPTNLITTSLSISYSSFPLHCNKTHVRNFGGNFIKLLNLDDRERQTNALHAIKMDITVTVCAQTGLG
jgi:hypothetical protein